MQPKRPCAQPGCSDLVARGYCTTHQRGRTEQRTAYRGTAAQQGYGYAWQQLRLRVLHDEPYCRHCLADGRAVPATDVDHITPREQGGTDDRSNLQPLCHPHHSRKTARDDGGFGRTARAG